MGATTAIAALAAVGLALATAEALGAEKQLLWGDTHLHSSNSFDAFLNRNQTADPETAYRYAKGLPVIHPFHRARVRIDTPLDFLVVSDHAELYGVIRHTSQRGVPDDDLGFFESLLTGALQPLLSWAVDNDYGMALFSTLLPTPGQTVEEAAANPAIQVENATIDRLARTMWHEAVGLADRHNDPGTFTALIGWEWSSIPGGGNLHRVVFTSTDAATARKFQPFSSQQSPYPEDLWKWLEQTTAETGAEFVAIPHNSNISKGYMFRDRSLRGEPFTAESARVRAHWEPVVEATQIKGDSETHPTLSPDDPFADFETYPHYIQTDPPPYDPKPGDYVRSALRLGLAIEEKIGFNPYRFGLIGSTDSHTGMASAEEPNFWGKLARDSIPENKFTNWRGDSGPRGASMSASGLAAVWSEENTREAILRAFRRRETYATTGPRMVVRVRAELAAGGTTGVPDGDLATAQASPSPVPMGGVLGAADPGHAPRLHVAAMKDPKGANLDRIQIVKGWIDGDGTTHEHVFDAAWSDGRVPSGGRLPPVGNTVDPDTGAWTNSIGAAELEATWTDPDFDPARRAFYYVRVLEIPTPRHTTFDALALGKDPRDTGFPWTIQERAYTSPIWYDPTQRPRS